MDWKENAEVLYKNGVKINDIAVSLKKSRKTISEHINSLQELKKLKEQRQQLSMENRKEYKRNWKRSNAVDSALMKRQHDIDVMVLSSEQYFNE